MSAFVIYGTDTGGFIFAFVRHTARAFTSRSDAKLTPSVVGTPFSLEALLHPFPTDYAFPGGGNNGCRDYWLNPPVLSGRCRSSLRTIVPELLAYQGGELSSSRRKLVVAIRT